MDIDSIPDIYLPPKYTRNVVFADGSQINAGGSLDGTGDYLWIWVDEPMSMMDAVNIFTNTDKISKIIVNRSLLDRDEYIGYTEIKNINVDIDKIAVRLGKPKNNA